MESITGLMKGLFKSDPNFQKPKVLFGIDLVHSYESGELPPLLEDWLSILEKNAHTKILDSKISPEAIEEAVKAIERAESLKKVTPALAFGLVKAFLELHPQPLICFNNFLSVASKIGKCPPIEFCGVLLKELPLSYISLLRRIMKLIRMIVLVHNLKGKALKALLTSITPLFIVPPEDFTISRKLSEQMENTIAVMVEHSDEVFPENDKLDERRWLNANRSLLADFFESNDTIISMSTLCSYFRKSESEMEAIIENLRKDTSPTDKMQPYLDLLKNPWSTSQLDDLVSCLKPTCAHIPALEVALGYSKSADQIALQLHLITRHSRSRQLLTSVLYAKSEACTSIESLQKVFRDLAEEEHQQKLKIAEEERQLEQKRRFQESYFEMAVAVIDKRSQKEQNFLSDTFVKGYELNRNATRDSLNFVFSNAPQTPQPTLSQEAIVQYTHNAFARNPSSSTPAPQHTPQPVHHHSVGYPETPTMATPIPLTPMTPPQLLANTTTPTTSSISVRKSTRTAAKKKTEATQPIKEKKESSKKAKPKILSEEQKATLSKLRTMKKVELLPLLKQQGQMVHGTKEGLVQRLVDGGLVLK